MKNNELNFNFKEQAVSNSKGQIRFTASLNAVSTQRAQEAMKLAATDPTLFELANAVIDDCVPAQLFEFMELTVGNNLDTDITVLDGATEDELSRLLESRRSDRSKTKAKNPRSSVTICLNYLATGYAELIVRKAWDKPYNEVGSDIVDTEDLDAVKRKISSLQSKKSRLSSLVRAGDASRSTELNEVIAEIARLNAIRGTTTVHSKTIITDSVDTATLRAALSQIDMTGMSSEQQSQLEALMKKLG